MQESFFPSQFTYDFHKKKKERGRKKKEERKKKRKKERKKKKKRSRVHPRRKTQIGISHTHMRQGQRRATIFTYSKFRHFRSTSKFKMGRDLPKKIYFLVFAADDAVAATHVHAEKGRQQQHSIFAIKNGHFP